MVVSTTEVGGGNTTNGQAAWKNQPKPTPNNKKQMEFTGDAKAERILYQKVTTSGANQIGKIITIIVPNLSSYIVDKGFL